jgi:dephospho-CoA kinase
MMLEIGLTGGIGSGKSTAARSFEALGYRVYYADDRAKLLYNEDADLRQAMIALVGPDIYDAQGKLERGKLAERIFKDKELLTQVNALVHPAVARDYEAWLRACPANYAKKLVIKEAAILFEAKTNTQLDGVIMVYAPKQLRIDRVCNRDGAAPAQVLARMAAQWPDSTKLQRADFTIYNDGIHPLLPQVQRAMQWMDTL